MPKSQKIAVIVPCYKVEKHILPLLEKIPSLVDRIYCVDDACPNGTGKLVERECRDPRVRVLYHSNNLGVGGAVKTGYRAAFEEGNDIGVKIDGDGQMDAALIPRFVDPLLKGECDYTKGNRFYSLDDTKGMPVVRLFGNAVLSFFSKLSTGYWNLFDPTNGYTAIHLSLLKALQLDKVSNRYFFESDMLFRLGINRCVVKDVIMRANYGSERSNLKVLKIFVPFLWGHFRNFNKRLFYNYYLRDFQVASIEFFLGPMLLIAGTAYAVYQWNVALETGVSATAGTVMIGALPIIIGMQFILSALGFDLQNIPKTPLHLALHEQFAEDNTSAHTAESKKDE